MLEASRDELLKAILEAADRHPNTRVSKLIRCVESEKSQKNIVLLLIELAEHPEFSSDFSISLKYYLDMFEEFLDEPSFPEAGLLLLNSALIYGKRVDSVHLTIQSLILSLINTEDAAAESNDLNANAAPKIKRGRKRPVEQISGPYEAVMDVKRFKVISASKRFDDESSNTNKRSAEFIENRVKDAIESLSNDFIHPTIWQYSAIEDFDYADELDSKKHYKLFTYHLEHRHNTLIPDINFKMYFKMKDFIDEENGDTTPSELWPPLSDAYIEHYLHLENIMLIKAGHDASNLYATDEKSRNLTESINTNIEEYINTNIEEGLPAISCSLGDTFEDQPLDLVTDSERVFENALAETSVAGQGDLPTEGIHDTTTLTVNNISDSGIHSELFVETQNTVTNETLSKADHDPTLLDPESELMDLSTIKVILPHLPYEGVFMSELNKSDQQMLSPSVVATDIFKCVKDKSNIVVIVDEDIERLFNIKEPSEVVTLPVFTCPEPQPLPLNILKLNPTCFKKRRGFRLGPEYDLLKSERYKKYTREKTQSQPRVCVHPCDNIIEVPQSPAQSLLQEPEFLGFPDESIGDLNRKSRDSGIIDDFTDCQNVLHSTLNPGESSEVLESELLKANESSILPTSTEEASNNDGLCDKETVTHNSKPLTDSGVVSDEVLEENFDIETSEHTSKVQDWHAHLQPILAQSRDRHHFDVFELGTEIMNQFDKPDKNGKISLQNVMEQKDKSLISRYFLSVLLLANQGNVGINVQNWSKDKPSELQDVELTLLSKKRNVVSLEDNIGLVPPQTSSDRDVACAKPTVTNIRTLKPVPIPKNSEEEADSGYSASISDEFSVQ